MHINSSFKILHEEQNNIIAFEGKDIIIQKVFKRGDRKVNFLEVQRFKLDVPKENQNIYFHRTVHRKKNLMLFFTERKLFVYRYFFNEKNQLIIKLLTSFETSFSSNEISGVVDREQLFVVTLKNHRIHFLYFDKKKAQVYKFRTMNQHELFQRINASSNKLSLIATTFNKQVWNDSNDGEVEHCATQNDRTDECFTVKNFLLDLFVNSDEKSWKISLHLNYILENRQLDQQEHLSLLKSNVEDSFFVAKNNYQVLRKEDGIYLRINESDYHRQLVDDLSYNLVYVNNETHAPFLVFSNKKKLKIVKVYLLEDYEEKVSTILLNDRGILTKTLEINLQKHYGFKDIENINIQTFTIRKMYNYILLKVKGKMIIWEIDMEGIKVTCNLNG